MTRFPVVKRCFRYLAGDDDEIEATDEDHDDKDEDPEETDDEDNATEFDAQLFKEQVIRSSRLQFPGSQHFPIVIPDCSTDRKKGTSRLENVEPTTANTTNDATTT